MGEAFLCQVCGATISVNFGKNTIELDYGKKGGFVSKLRHSEIGWSALIEFLKRQVGKPYVFGVENDPKENNWNNYKEWDCCLDSETMVHTNHGPKPIKCILPGDRVYSLNGWDLEMANVVSISEPKKQDCFKLICRGRDIIASANHPFAKLVKKNVGKVTGGHHNKWWIEWTKLSDLEIGDYLLTMDSAKESESGYFDIIPEQARLLGCFIGDGWLNKNDGKGYTASLCLYGDKATYYSELIVRLFPNSRICRYPNQGLNIRGKEFFDFILTNMGNNKSFLKFVPPLIWESSNDVKREFLMGYLDSDGSLNKRGYWEFKASSIKLISEIRILCIELGVNVSRISINNREKPIFIKGKRVKKALPLYCFEAYPNSSRKNVTIMKNYGLGRFIKKGSGLSIAKIKAIEPVGLRDTYDIEVSDRHNFCAAGLVVHNSELVEIAFFKIHINIPDGSYNQAAVCTPIVGDPIIGDLGFKWHPENQQIHHVGIYIGDDMVIEAKGKAWGVVATPVKNFMSSPDWAYFGRLKQIENS